MNVLEKILEEIKDLKEKQNSSNQDYATGYLSALSTVEGIISGVKENDGWIPVEERLPESDGFYLATLDGEICGQEEAFAGLAEFEHGKWIDDEEGYKCVLAWQPLPKPYRPDPCHGCFGAANNDCQICDKGGKV